MEHSNERRLISMMVDYLFGRGVSSALPKRDLKLIYSPRSGRPKLIFHSAELLATIKPSGSMALSLYGAELLAKSPRFKENYVQISDDVAEFIRNGRSVFCKFVVSAGKNVLPKSEVAVVDGKGTILGVGTAVLNGKDMAQFKSGVAVKVRAGLRR